MSDYHFLEYMMEFDTKMVERVKNFQLPKESEEQVNEAGEWTYNDLFTMISDLFYELSSSNYFFRRIYDTCPTFEKNILLCRYIKLLLDNNIVPVSKADAFAIANLQKEDESQRIKRLNLNIICPSPLSYFLEIFENPIEEEVKQVILD